MSLRFSFLIALFLVGTCLGNDIVEENKCVPDRCQNGGKCFQLDNSVICQCGFGFLGRYCEEHAIPAFNFLHYDPEYMHEHPKNPWGRRLETDAIRPLFAESTKTLADVLQRLYYNMIQFNNLSQKKPDQNNIGFVAK